jgi:hypothetical protein
MSFATGVNLDTIDVVADLPVARYRLRGRGRLGSEGSRTNEPLVGISLQAFRVGTISKIPIKPSRQCSGRDCLANPQE